MTAETTTFAEQYRQQQHAIAQEREIVDVKVPSGAVFQFYKPDSVELLFGIGHVPMNAASRAVEAWQKNGLLKPEDLEGDPELQQDAMQLFNVAIRTRDRVIKLSYRPKLVMGSADESKGEMSTDDVSSDDLAYLYQWVQAGGDTAVMVGNFRGGSSTGPVAQPNRQERRATAKRTRKTN